jgi:hypothetical protein
LQDCVKLFFELRIIETLRFSVYIGEFECSPFLVPLYRILEKLSVSPETVVLAVAIGVVDVAREIPDSVAGEGVLTSGAADVGLATCASMSESRAVDADEVGVD